MAEETVTVRTSEHEQDANLTKKERKRAKHEKKRERKQEEFEQKKLEVDDVFYVTYKTHSITLGTRQGIPRSEPPPSYHSNNSFVKPMRIKPRLVPMAAIVPAAGGTSTHALTNACSDKIVFDIWPSNNRCCSVEPAHGFIEPGATAQIQIARRTGPPSQDKFVIKYASVPKGSVDAERTFKEVKEITHVGRIVLTCTAK